MNEHFTVRQAARAANISRLRLDQWVSRGYLAPKHTPEPGEARAYQIDDVIEIATLAELGRLGIPPGVAASWVRYLNLFHDDDALLVVWQGPVELIPTSKRGDPPSQVLRTPGGWTRNHPGASTFYDPNSPPFGAAIVRPGELPEMARDPDKRSLVFVNLNHVEKRVLAALAESGAGN